MPSDVTTIRGEAIYVVHAVARAREAVCRLFESTATPIRVYSNADDFLAELPVPGGGWLICQFDLPGTTAIRLLQTLRARGEAFPAFVLAHDVDLAIAVRSMQAGAIDVFDQAEADARLVQRVREVLERGS